MLINKKSVKKQDSDSTVRSEHMNDMLNHPVNKAIFNRLKDL